MKAVEKELILFFSSVSMTCYPFGKAKCFHWFSFHLHGVDSAPRFLLLIFSGERKSNIETSVSVLKQEQLLFLKYIAIY